MKTFFTSDEHYFHENIIKYCNRPFANADEMNQAMIQAHNEVVSDGDIVYHLGDFTFRSPRTATSIIRQLNGCHRFICGNHDDWIRSNERDEALDELQNSLNTQRFLKVHSLRDYEEIRGNLNGQKYHIVMFHFPMLTWHKAHKGSIHLHGHTHGNIDSLNEKAGIKRFDMGVDTAFKKTGKYRPFELSEVLEMASKKEINTLDFGE